MRRLLACALLAVTAACGGSDDAPPVATPSFTASKTRVPLGSPVELTYAFDVTAPINGDYLVFVHFVDNDGQQMFTDDHEPPVPSSQWKVGQKVQYTRTVFMPIFPYHGPATVTLGLYNGPTRDDRLPLAGKSRTREYAVGTIELLPQSENIFLTLGGGWHNRESAGGVAAREWQWLSKSGTVAFRNPKKDITLYLEADTFPQVFGSAPLSIAITSNGAEVARFAADNAEPRLRLFTITAAQLGADDTARLTFTADKTFVPAQTPGMGGDPREMSIRVYNVFVEAR